MVSTVASYYNVPHFSWAATAIELADASRYPTLTRVIGSAFRLVEGIPHRHAPNVCPKNSDSGG